MTDYSSRATVDLIDSIEENPLDAYDQLTYHLKFYMLGESDIIARNYTDETKQIIIAESGRSDIGIDGLELDSIVGYDSTHRTGYSTKFEFTLMEPHGARLLDNIFAAGATLGIQNYQKIPYFLELSFRARDTSSSNPLSGSEINQLKWVYPIMIRNIVSNVTSGGTTYSVSAIRYDDMGYTDQLGMLDKTLAVEGITFGDFTSEMQRVMNQWQDDKQYISQLEKDEYEIILYDGLADVKIAATDGTQNASRSNSFEINNVETTNADGSTSSSNGGDIDKKILHVHKGTDVLKIVEQLLSSSDFFDTFTNRTPTATNAPEDATRTNRSQTFKDLYRVKTETDIIKFDNARGDYARKVTYHIFSYKTARAVTSPQDRPTTPQENENRVQALKNQQVLKKRYDYIFTGLNDQIIDFDLTLNYAWLAAIPVFAGIYNNYYATDTGSRNNSVTPNSVFELQRLLRRQNGLVSQIEQLNEVIDSGDNNPQIQTELFKTRGVAISELNENKAPIQQINDLLYSNGTIPTESEHTQYGNELAGRSRENLVEPKEFDFKSNPRFVTDFSLSDIIDNINNNNSAGYPIPLSLIEHSTGDSVFGFESAFHNGRSLFSSLFTQLLGSYNGDLLRIELNIKGDPFWIGDVPLKANQTAPRVDPKVEISKVATQYYTAENYFVFSSQTPKIADDNSGLVSGFDQNTIINGIYSVLKVTHKFTDGKFTQTLTAAREPLTDISQVKKIL